jgi:RNA polymerase sigma factor (sigma-70 family)
VATAEPAHPEAPQASSTALAERIYAAHRGRLLAIARRNCASGEEAEDALQDAFALFIDRFDPGAGPPPLAWLTVTLKRRCWLLYRGQRKVGQRTVDLDTAAENVSRPDLLADPSLRPDELAEATEDLAGMRSRLAQLKPQERQALGLLALGYSYLEICEQTGWTFTKVNRCLAEGRAALRKLTPGGER